MTRPNDITAFVCKGPAFDALRAYKEEIDALISDHDKLQETFNELAKKQKGIHEAKLHELWVTMAMRVGLDPVKTWQNPEYQIETRYLEEGFGAIVYEPIVSEQCHELFGKGDKEDTPALIEVPDRKRMH